MRAALFLLAFASSALARPASQSVPSSSIKTRNTAATSPADISPYVQPIKWAEIPYCDAAVNTTVASLQIFAVGGDGKATPHWIVGYNNAGNTIVVAHQGTNTQSAESIANDVNFKLAPLISAFSSINPDKSLSAHAGFQAAWSRSVGPVGEAINALLQAHPRAKVLFTGHSLGAAISSLDALFFSSALPSSTSISAILYGLPRVGNQAYANTIDAKFNGKFTYVVNFKDPVPHLPTLGDYVHPSGQVWINPAGSNTAVNCPGQENFNCANKYPLPLGNQDEHNGPYFGTSIGGSMCPDNLRAMPEPTTV